MVSIIICTYNREKYLPETLERLAANEYKGQWELILVDNNSTDSTRELCMRFQVAHPEVPMLYVTENKQGLSYARNRGMKEAKGDWMVFLDDDAFVGKTYLRDLVACIKVLPDMDAFGGKILPFFEDGKAPKWLCRWNKSWLSAMDMGPEVLLMTGNQFPIGANMGFSRKIMEKCGSFNPHLGRTKKNLLGGEEKDYFDRIKIARGLVYYLPDIPVEHCIPASRMSFDYIRALGHGVGVSEKLRTQPMGLYGKRIWQEFVKWLATIVLWGAYAVRGRFACGNSLVVFRHHVTRGLLS